MKTLLVVAPLALASLGRLPAAHGQSAAPAPYRVLSTIPVGGEGGWDFLATDPAGERLYVAHGTQTEVIDLKTKKLLGHIENTPGAHGVAVVPGANRGYVSCGRNNYCVIFDLKTLKNLGTVATGPKPDAVYYDDYSKHVFAFSNAGGKSTVLDPATGRAVGTAELGGDVEVPASDGKGHIFVNLEDKSEVIEFDAKSLAVLHRYSLAPGEEPTGLAFDPKDGRLFSGCANEKLVVTDSKTGKQVAVLPIGPGVDGVAFDPTTNNVLSFNGGDGTMTVIHQDSPEKYTVVANVPTAKGARTVAENPKTHHLYTCTADYGPAPAATTENPRPRPSILPGTFRVLEIGK
ncbi:YncE family protein [Hymenobacter sp. RP-2-7]|uniref:YncE family protein n=1 Tax=Hymenobacter polaris TaxID=2682546 RepID=A0A7Y0ABR0_9BACT|nr:YncE family protein [Hymenobacter polaris]NML64431.1 YncE family protein [Hymenobacter polaris]